MAVGSSFQMFRCGSFPSGASSIVSLDVLCILSLYLTPFSAVVGQRLSFLI